MLRVGIVAEGKSDWWVLETIIRSIHPDVDFERLRPDMTLVSHSPHGWRGVKAWCQQEGVRLPVLMTGVVGRPLHLVIIHADCSMAQNEAARRPCPPASDTADALRDVIRMSWLNHQNGLPPYVVLATPSQGIDTWVISVQTPPYQPANLECDTRVENEFVARGLLRRKGTDVRKPAARYLPLVAAMTANLSQVYARCSQAARFQTEFRTAVARLPPL